MAFHFFPDVFSWLEKLRFNQLSTLNSLNLCPSSTPSLKLSLKNPNLGSFVLFIYVDYNNLPVVLWTSKALLLPKSGHNKLTDDSRIIASLLIDFVETILKYAPNNSTFTYSIEGLPTTLKDNFNEAFNFCFLTLTFVVCIYEAPGHVRCTCLHSLKDQFACPRARSVSKVLIRALGSNVEEIWMRSINLAITNWIVEIQAARMVIKTPSPLFSYSLSTFGLWKIQLYCPIIAMNVERRSSSSDGPDERLTFSLNYHQLDAIIQLNYNVIGRQNSIEVIVNVDNIRCDVVPLLTKTLLNDRGAGDSEKHFPSRIAIQITPVGRESSIISVSAGKSSDNPATEVSIEKAVEASFEPPAGVGLNLSVGETTTTTVRPWKFEQSVYGNSGNLSWFLHDSGDGREVSSSKPSRAAMLHRHHKAWFRDRYASAGRPFTRRGGVVFAGDEYGEGVRWKVEGGGGGRRMEWEVKGWVWVTYWPNKSWTGYSETRRLEFREVLHLSLV